MFDMRSKDSPGLSIHDEETTQIDEVPNHRVTALRNLVFGL